MRGPSRVSCASVRGRPTLTGQSSSSAVAEPDRSRRIRSWNVRTAVVGGTTHPSARCAPASGHPRRRRTSPPCGHHPPRPRSTVSLTRGARERGVPNGTLRREHRGHIGSWRRGPDHDETASGGPRPERGSRAPGHPRHSLQPRRPSSSFSAARPPPPSASRGRRGRGRPAARRRGEGRPASHAASARSVRPPPTG